MSLFQNASSIQQLDDSLEPLDHGRNKRDDKRAWKRRKSQSNRASWTRRCSCAYHSTFFCISKATHGPINRSWSTTVFVVWVTGKTDYDRKSRIDASGQGSKHGCISSLFFCTLWRGITTIIILPEWMCVASLKPYMAQPEVCNTFPLIRVQQSGSSVGRKERRSTKRRTRTLRIFLCTCSITIDEFRIAVLCRYYSLDPESVSISSYLNYAIPVNSWCDGTSCVQ